MRHPILIQRAYRHKDGWKLRFGCGTLITTVVEHWCHGDRGNYLSLDDAITRAVPTAAANFASMSAANRKASRLRLK